MKKPWNLSFKQIDSMNYRGVHQRIIQDHHEATLGWYDVLMWILNEQNEFETRPSAKLKLSNQINTICFHGLAAACRESSLFCWIVRR